MHVKTSTLLDVYNHYPEGVIFTTVNLGEVDVCHNQ